MDKKFVSIGQAAHMIGVAVSTLRRWDGEGTFVPATRTLGHHRRYDVRAIIMRFFPEKEAATAKRLTIAYARVSGWDQRSDLQTQVKVLRRYCNRLTGPYALISDIGSGVNFGKPGLTKLIRQICEHRVKRVVVTHRDRLLRLGSKLLFQICEHFDVEVVVLNEAPAQSFEQQFAADLIEIVSAFSGRLHGKRSHANRRAMKEAA